MFHNPFFYDVHSDFVTVVTEMVAANPYTDTCNGQNKQESREDG